MSLVDVQDETIAEAVGPSEDQLSLKREVLLSTLTTFVDTSLTLVNRNRRKTRLKKATWIQRERLKSVSAVIRLASATLTSYRPVCVSGVGGLCHT